MALPLSERMLIVLDAVERGCAHQLADDVSTGLVAAYAHSGVKATLRTLRALERRDYVEMVPAERFIDKAHDHWKATVAGKGLLSALAQGAANIRLLNAQERNLSVRGRLSPLAERAA